MNILFTGASSFTGCWFVRELASAGHRVWATFRQPPDGYEGIRGRRVAGILDQCTPVSPCAFGDAKFLELIQSRQWDVLCHHAAEVSDYRSPDFNVSAAVANNTHNLRKVLAALRNAGCRRVVLTGTVFEPHEGTGDQDNGILRAFSPYGLSKGLTAEVFRYYTQEAGLHLGKFVIPNPFGPYEEPRFTAYLIRTWYAGDVAGVRTPAYVRDNIHVTLLTKAYARLVESLPEEAGFTRANPSGYIESQGAFAERFAREMRPRLNLSCELQLAEQTEFDEPKIRINTDLLDAGELGWDEQRAWDEIAEYYESAQRAAS